MKLTSDEALKMLKEMKKATKCTGWIYHSICVGDSAGKIAKELNLDVDKAKALGYIHDIGKGVGEFESHVINGYKYMKELGYGEGYLYPHNFPGHWIEQQYLPDKIRNRKYYIPKDTSKYERDLKKVYEAIEKMSTN